MKTFHYAAAIMGAVSATDRGPVPDVGTSTVPVEDERRHRSGFWAVAFAFLIVMAVATLPSPLYGLYRTRDHLLALTITLVFAIFVGSTIALLRWDSAIATRIGRRPLDRRLPRTVDELSADRALPGFRRRSGVPAGNGRAAGIARARARNCLHAYRPGTTGICSRQARQKAASR
jgi:hypothetical protein